MHISQSWARIKPHPFSSLVALVTTMPKNLSTKPCAISEYKHFNYLKVCIILRSYGEKNIDSSKIILNQTTELF